MGVTKVTMTIPDGLYNRAQKLIEVEGRTEQPGPPSGTDMDLPVAHCCRGVT